MPAPSPSALVDTVDSADRPIGTVPREAVFARAAGFRVVHVFVFDPEGRLLLQRLGRRRKRNPLKWGSSVAGYLHAGEAHLEAATRRLREELGLETGLAKHGSLWMSDRGCRKFVTLYTTCASDPRIGEPEHIEEIAFWSTVEVERGLAERPEEFTETFRFVYRFYESISRLNRVH
jgi:isopentenyl-diphosphate delta-isomerase